MNIQRRLGIEVCPRNRNKKVIQICHVTDATPASSRKIELSKSRAGIISFSFSPPPFPFFAFIFLPRNADFEMEVARLKRHFFFFCQEESSRNLVSLFSPSLLLLRYCCAHKYLNKITIRGKEVGLIFKKAPPCIKDYETTMVESGGNFLRDYSCEIVYREILKRRSTFLSFLAILIFFFFFVEENLRGKQFYAISTRRL